MTEHTEPQTCTRCDSEDWQRRYSLGIYAGRYCDECWKQSGYRDEGPEGFDPLDAGEAYDEEFPRSSRAHLRREVVAVADALRWRGKGYR